MRKLPFCLFLAFFPLLVRGIGTPPFVDFSERSQDFPLVSGGKAAEVCVDSHDWPGVVRAVGDFVQDVDRVAAVRPGLEYVPAGKAIVLIGTVGRSASVDELARRGLIDVAPIRGKWESHLRQVVDHPFPGVDRALVIAGSDKRGTIYGIYQVSEQIGVSPWYWWADVPVARHAELLVRPELHVTAEPAVRYRGIFLNDEAPALTGWANERFGGLNGVFYSHVFELMLRLGANYLWPAMWDNAFNEDDPGNPRLADEYGIVMGTSHQEPMLRAQKEWDRGPGKIYGPWNYAKPELRPVLQQFWREGIRRNKDYESLITLGLRSENDSGAPVGKAMTEQIVEVQRKILAEEMNPDVAKIPQVWCLYKEVQGYYEDGMRVPDDVTLLWTDDNFGNLRRLPTPAERKRTGGAGIYYHFDYVGVPRSYKWLDTNPIPRVWEQLDLAYRYGADRIWIVNVGDLKPMEFPMQFFMDEAWRPERWTADRLGEYGRRWAAQQFGPDHAAEIADLIAGYAKFNGRRKPELLGPETYSLADYGEADRVVKEFNALAARAEKVEAELPPEYRSAFFQLVLYPVKACAVVNELYVTVAKNRLYAEQGRVSAGAMAERARALFVEDAALSERYNREECGKWNHMMDQSHIGYTGWHDTAENVMPALTEVGPVREEAWGVAVEGSKKAWAPSAGDGQREGGDRAGMATLPAMDDFDRRSRSVVVFRKGRESIPFKATPAEPWLRVLPDRGTLGPDARVVVMVDWASAPQGRAEGHVTIEGPGGAVRIAVPIFNPAEPRPDAVRGFVETSGYVSIEAEHYEKAVTAGGIGWRIIPDFGRTLSGVTTCPVTAPSAPVATGSAPLAPSANLSQAQGVKENNPSTQTGDAAPAASLFMGGPNSPHLEYGMYLFSTGPVKVELYAAPTLNFVPGRGLRCGVSMDGGPVQVVDLLADRSLRAWAKAVSDNIRVATVHEQITRPGYHTLKFWRVDPAFVLEKIVIDAGGVRPSYLGPPESFHRG